MSKQKREEEQRIIAEMEAGMQENAKKKEETAMPVMNESNTAPTVIHCKRCRTVMENGRCPTCGFKIYVPMDEQKQKKIRMVVGTVCIVIFLILFLFTQVIGK
ncbi:MAG: hypothetical protein IJX88_03690 [Clostridia bacterium]|nr:hypothetical protein [Clostridia bacterium]